MPVADMKPYHDREKEKLIKEVEIIKSKGVVPKLWIITDGKDERCKTYMKSKLKIAEEVGIEAEVKIVEDKQRLKDVMARSYHETATTIMQLPIKKELEDWYSDKSFFNQFDVDGFFSYQELMEGDWGNAPCTAKGVANYIINKYESVRGKTAVLIGYGKLTNRPLSAMLSTKGATCVVINSSTSKEFKASVLKQADIVVCASGIKGSVKMSDLAESKEVLVVNVGTIFDSNGKLTTELEIDEDKSNVIYTPRICGTGVLTTTNLMVNVVNFYKNII